MLQIYQNASVGPGCELTASAEAVWPANIAATLCRIRALIALPENSRRLSTHRQTRVHIVVQQHTQQTTGLCVCSVQPTTSNPALGLRGAGGPASHRMRRSGALHALHTGTGTVTCALNVLRIRSCHRITQQPPALATRDFRAEAMEAAMGVLPARTGARWAGSTHAVRAPLAAPHPRVLSAFRSASVPAALTSPNTSQPALPVPEAAPARRPRRRKTASSRTGPPHIRATHNASGSSPRVSRSPCSSGASKHRSRATMSSSSAAPLPCAIRESKSCAG